MHLEDTDFKLRICVECFVECNSNVLMFKRSSDSKVFPNYLSIPGGHVDVDEDVMSACIREVYEETGLEVNENTLTLKYVAYHKHLDRNEIWNVFGFYAKLPNVKKLTKNIEGRAFWVKINDLKNLDIFPPVKYYIPHTISVNSGLLFVSAEYKKANLSKIASSKLVNNT